MQLLAQANLAGQMIAVLRQELDSMVRVIYLLTQAPARRASLIELSVSGERWRRSGSRSAMTDREMIEKAHALQGWTQSVYKFGCAFIHLSSLHDYNDRDPLKLLPANEREDLLQHCRHYHGGPTEPNPSFLDLVPYMPRVLEKISANLEHYLAELENGKLLTATEA